MSVLTLPKFDLNHPETLFVAGPWVEPSSSEMIDMITPTTEEVTIGFGGFRQSGLGREGGVEGLLPYSKIKTMLLDALPASLR